MTPDRSQRPPHHGAGPCSSFEPHGWKAVTTLVRRLNGAGSRTALSVVAAVLLTGIGLSCLFANVLAGHSIVFALP